MHYLAGRAGSKPMFNRFFSMVQCRAPPGWTHLELAPVMTIRKAETGSESRHFPNTTHWLCTCCRASATTARYPLATIVKVTLWASVAVLLCQVVPACMECLPVPDWWLAMSASLCKGLHSLSPGGPCITAAGANLREVGVLGSRGLMGAACMLNLSLISETTIVGPGRSA